MAGAVARAGGRARAGARGGRRAGGGGAGARGARAAAWGVRRDAPGVTPLVGAASGVPPPVPASAVGGGLWGLASAERAVLALGFVACSLSGALAVFLMSAVGTLGQATRTLREVELLAREAREELPGTAAAVQMSGAELSDAFEEIGDLGADLSAGVRQTARTITTAQAGIGAGAEYLGRKVGPTVREKVAPAVGRAVGKALRDNADLDRRPLLARASRRVRAVAKAARTVAAVNKVRKNSPGGQIDPPDVPKGEK